MAKRTKKRRGPKPKYSDITCPNPKCKHRGKKGLGNVVSNGTYQTRSTGKARLFLCRTCGKAFSSRTGTAFFDLRSRKKKILMGLRLLAEGLGLRATSRVLEIKLDTIRKWLAVAALHCEQVSDMLLRDLKLSQVQVDELWTFVKKNTKMSLGGQPQGPVSSPKRAGP
jgi:transposase-like protein